MKKAVEKGILSKKDAIGALNEMVSGGFRISASIYSKFLDELEII